jgi:hypothetical protein
MQRWATMQRATYATRGICNAATMQRAPMQSARCVQREARRRASRPHRVQHGVCARTARAHGAVNKQLNDKERVAAAIENGRLLDVVNKCLAGVP